MMASNKNPEAYIKHQFESRPVSPSPDAWSRIQVNVKHRRSRTKVYSIAAALMAIIMLSWFFWRTDQNKSVQEVTTQIITAEPSPFSMNSNRKAVEKEIESQHIKTAFQSTENQTRKQNALQPKNENDLQVSFEKWPVSSGKGDTNFKREETVAEIENNLPSTSQNQPEKSSGTKSNDVTLNTAPEISTETFTLVYTSNSVDQKFLKAKRPDLTTRMKQPASGLRKVMEVAYSIKYMDTGYGDLRHAKDELLSLPFHGGTKTN